MLKRQSSRNNKRIRSLERESLRSAITEGVRAKLKAAVTTFYAGRLYFISDWLGGTFAYDNGTELLIPQMPTSDTLSTLQSLTDVPTPWLAYATNGRKEDELANNGTGVLVWYDGTDWLRVSDNEVALE